jgi:dihydroorotate dehydrogenase electron transfer subunit
MSQHLQAEIISHREVAPRHFRMELAASAIASEVRPGHYVHVLPRSTASYDPLLRRAFSILKRSSDSIDILYRIEGRGTAQMARLVPGDTLDILGPLGRPFAPPQASSILVGGGVGVPPMAMLASICDPKLTLALIGARSQVEVICGEDFQSCNVPVKVATDDGSAGHRGRVTDLLEQALRDAGAHEPAPVVYACGPLPMLRAVANLARQYGVRCQVSLEENMPCGVGVCNGCVVPVQGAGDDYGSYRRICVDGPVLWADEVDWARYPGGGC